METEVRKVAWAIAEAWWRRTHRQAAGVLLDADSAADYADRCWQEWVGEARCALKALGAGSDAGVDALKPGLSRVPGWVGDAGPGEAARRNAPHGGMTFVRSALL